MSSKIIWVPRLCLIELKSSIIDTCLSWSSCWIVSNSQTFREFRRPLSSWRNSFGAADRTLSQLSEALQGYWNARLLLLACLYVYFWKQYQAWPRTMTGTPLWCENEVRLRPRAIFLHQDRSLEFLEKLFTFQFQSDSFGMICYHTAQSFEDL